MHLLFLTNSKDYLIMKNFILTGVSFLLLFLSISVSAQSTLYFTNTGGSFTSEKWISITTGPDNTGTVIWAQGDGTIGNASGLLTDQAFTVTDGVDFYVNCYDQYDDSWDGTTYEVRDAPSGGGILVINNGGASPSDGADTDATSSWDGTEEERETSEVGNYTPPACTTPTFASAVVVPSCPGGFGIDVDVTDLGDGTPVITDGASSWPASLGVNSVGPFADGASVTLTLEHGSDPICDVAIGTFTYACPIPGQLCDDPLPVGSLPFSTTDDTALYFDDYSSADEACSGSSYLNGDDVVYSYTPSANETVDIVLSGTGTWTGVFVYSDCPFATCEGSDTQSSGNPSITGLDLTAGTTYYIVISTFPAPQSTAYTLDIFVPSCTPPVATIAADVSTCPNLGVTVDITDIGTAVSIDITDDQGTSALTVTATGMYNFGSYAPGTSVVVSLIFSDGNAANPICDLVLPTVDLACPPPNDDCDDAIMLTVNPDFSCAAVTPSTIEGATASGDDETTCFGTEDDDVWFSFVATDVSHTVDLLNITGGTTDLYHSVWSGTCGALVNVNCSDPNSSTLTGLTIGDTYYLRVYSWTSTPGQTSAFDVCIGTPPPPPPAPACDGMFVDSGGSGNYSANEDITWTICPDVVGDVVTTSFTSFLVEGRGVDLCWDFLFIYDGNSTAATPITPASLGLGAGTSGFCYQSATDGTADLTGVAITSTSADGCLTFNFTSDGSGQFAGWEADVTCAPPPGCDASNNLELPAAGTPATIVAVAGTACDDVNGWTYYEDPNTGEYMFAIDWGTNGNNDAAKAAAMVTLEIQAMPGMAEGGTPGVSGAASWSMARFWDVDLGGAAVVDPVSVRFYYDPMEKVAIETAAMNDGRAVEPFRWFKTTTGAYPGMPTPTGPVNEIDLTPNLVSDTGVEDGFTYAEFSGITSFSGGTFVTAVNGSVVPVELHSLKGQAHDKFNTITWSTASEINNDYQMVQTSADGRTNWQEVGKVQASNTSAVSNYVIRDYTPRMQSYYRVKSVDYDGYTAYSNIVMVERSDFSVKGISSIVSPNPFSDKFEVSIQSDAERTVRLSLLDIQGRVIINQNMTLVNGINKNIITMDQYETGIYLLRIATNDNEEVIKLVKN
jgi:hypothetical protein